MLTKRSVVRVLPEEPNELATNSRFFWLAARCPGLAGNGQYCGETVALWYGNIARRSKPEAPLSHSWATFSVAPTGRALLVNGGSSACRGGGQAFAL
jgi:hypothetical protein